MRLQQGFAWDPRGKRDPGPGFLGTRASRPLWWAAGPQSSVTANRTLVLPGHPDPRLRGNDGSEGVAAKRPHRRIRAEPRHER